MIRLIFLLLVLPGIAVAYVDKGFYLGVGYYSQNALGKTTTSSTSAPSFLGASSYPVTLKYDWRVGMDWYLSPQLNWTLLPRSMSGNSAKVTMLQLQFPFGKNMGMGNGWDWSVGPGVSQYSVKGAGGTTVLSNGTGSATFAMPGESIVIQTVTASAGSSYQAGSNRFGLDMVIEGLFSEKRSMSLMLSYGYRFGGGLR